MSWYKARLDHLRSNPGSTTKPCPCNQPAISFFHAVGKEFAYTIKIPDMKNKSDAERISSALLTQTGVAKVKPLLHQKSLTVYFNPASTSLSTIARIVDGLGYRHVRRG